MYDELVRILARSFQVDPQSLTPDSTLDDMGMDSLDLVELSMMIEQDLGISVPDDTLAEAAGLGAMADIVSSRLEAVA